MSATDSLAWNYRHSTAGFAGNERLIAQPLIGLRRELVGFQISIRTERQNQYRMLKQVTYTAIIQTNRIGNYSGGTWRATVRWQPSAKTEIDIGGWRELQAYIDAQSDYFVSQRGTLKHYGVQRQN